MLFKDNFLTAVALASKGDDCNIDISWQVSTQFEWNMLDN